MKNITKALLGLGLLAGTAAPALAADYSADAPVSTSGFYVRGDGAWSWLNTDTRDDNTLALGGGVGEHGRGARAVRVALGVRHARRRPAGSRDGLRPRGARPPARGGGRARGGGPPAAPAVTPPMITKVSLGTIGKTESSVAITKITK